MSSGMSLLQEFQRHRQQQLKKQKQKVLPVTSSIESTSSLSPNNETKVATVPPRSTEPIVTTRNSNDSCNKSNDGLPSPLSDDILVRDSSLKNHHYGSGTSITSSSQKDEQQMAEDSTPPQDDDDDDVLITVCTGINCGALKQEKGKRRQQHYKDQVGDNIGNSTTTIATTRTKHNPGSTTATACGGTACHGGVGIGGSGTGTSAALIEIEELITEYHFQKEQCMQKNDNHKNNENGCHYDDHDDSSSVQPQHTPYLRVTSAGCTHHCTVGPNVFVRRMHNTTTKRLTNKVTRFVEKEQKQQEKELQHFTRVDSVAQCNHVMACATQAYKDANNKENAGSTYEKSDNSLLQIRADGIRWKALRELVRTEAAPTQEEGQQTHFHNQYKESARDMLQKAYDAEIMAAGKNVKKEERARRRSKRLFTRLNYHTTNDRSPTLT